MRNHAPLLRAVLAALRRTVPFTCVEDWARESQYDTTALYEAWNGIVGSTGPTPKEFIDALLLMYALQHKVSNVGWAARLCGLGVSKARLDDIATRFGLPDVDALVRSDVFQFVEFFEERMVAQALAPIAAARRKRRGRPPRTKTDRQTVESAGN